VRRSWVPRRRLFLVFVLFWIPSSFAQRDLGTITGVLTDASGTVVSRAKLTFAQETTSESFSAETGDTGTYVRPLLCPGLYTVEAEATGFRKAVEKEVLVTERGRAGVDLVMTVGAVTQTAEVTAAAPLLQTQSTIEGQDIGQQGCRTCRSVASACSASWSASRLRCCRPSRAHETSTAAVSPPTASAQAATITFFFDGVDNNNNVVDLQGGSSYIIKPSMDAIGEMLVLVNGRWVPRHRFAGDDTGQGRYPDLQNMSIQRFTMYRYR